MHPTLESLTQQAKRGQLSRRDFMRRAMALGMDDVRRAADRVARASGLSAHEDRRLIRAAYAGLLGREPGDDEVAHWQAQLAIHRPAFSHAPWNRNWYRLRAFTARSKTAFPICPAIRPCR